MGLAIIRRVKETQEIDPENATVDLRPVLGIPPTTYVPVLYALAAVIALFFLLVFPGIRHHGALVTFATSPADVSIRIDGRRLGTAPGTYFVPSGEREIVAVRPGFESSSEVVEIGGRLFASLLFPRRETISIHLKNADVDRLISSASAELARWAMLGEASGQYQFPPIARGLSSDLSAASDDPIADTGRFLSDMLPQVNSQAIMNDLASAVLQAGSPAPVATPAGIAALVRVIAAADAQTPGLALQAAQALGQSDLTGSLEASQWYAASAAAFAATRAVSAPAGPVVTSAPPVVFPLGLRFVRVRGAGVSQPTNFASRGGEIPRVVTADLFVGTTEVPASAFLRFLDENPEWADREALTESGRADDDYLAEIETLRADPNLPVSSVSFYAAEAFAAWYSGLLQEGLVARLPSENEWDAVRLAAAGQEAEEGAFAPAPRPEPAIAESGRIQGLLGNLWEWTGDWYAPFAYLYASPTSVGAHKVVRGGGYATERRGFDPADRGSLAPEWASPFVGFRLVIVETDE
jgi:formylglycine-generating enzyme required for sulfatase activity